MKFDASLAVLALAGCGGVAHTQSTQGGCPSAAQVGFAQWARPQPAKGDRAVDAAWLIRLGERAAGPGAPEPGPLQGYEVAKLGLGPLPPTVWLLRAGAPACAGTIAGYVAERVEDGPPSIMISAVLTGCPAGAEPYARGWISLASAEPVGCEVRLPEADGARRADDPGGVVTVAAETEATRLPDRWLPFAPAGACAAPCTTLWSVETIAGTPALHALQIADVEPGPAACARAEDRAAGLYATATDGSLHPLRGAAVDASGWAPLAETTLAGALHDGGGNRVVLAVGLDDWSAYDVSADGALGDGRTVQYFVARTGDRLPDALAPTCD